MKSLDPESPRRISLQEFKKSEWEIARNQSTRICCCCILPVCVSDGEEGDDVPDGEHPRIESQDVVQGTLERDVVEYLVPELIWICLEIELMPQYSGLAITEITKVVRGVGGCVSGLKK